MFDRIDEQYLLRVLGQNQVLLFLGAGFSRDTRNQLGSQLPSGRDLSKLFWEFLGYEGEYDGTSLAEMYQAVLASGIKHKVVEEFLNSHLLCAEIPTEYDQLVRVFWYRIYTTNVDNLVEEVYRRSGGPQLDILIYPKDDIRERDQLLDRIQLIHLKEALNFWSVAN